MRHVMIHCQALNEIYFNSYSIYTGLILSLVAFYPIDIQCFQFEIKIA